MLAQPSTQCASAGPVRMVRENIQDGRTADISGRPAGISGSLHAGRQDGQAWQRCVRWARGATRSHALMLLSFYHTCAGARRTRLMRMQRSRRPGRCAMLRSIQELSSATAPLQLISHSTSEHCATGMHRGTMADTTRLPLLCIMLPAGTTGTPSKAPHGASYHGEHSLAYS